MEDSRFVPNHLYVFAGAMSHYIVVINVTFQSWALQELYVQSIITPPTFHYPVMLKAFVPKLMNFENSGY